MEHIITTKHAIYKMSSENKAALTVPCGSTVIFETYDCFENQITREDQEMDELDWERINPATGPLYIEGALVGDTLKVEIQKIDIADEFTMVTGKKLGVLGSKLENTWIKRGKIDKQRGVAIFSDKFEIPLRKMIGVIGTAPNVGESISCGIPDYHGGNMDCGTIGEGAILYLPVSVEGALLAMGDLHATMGDGEVSVCGAEIPGRVTVKVSVIKETLPTPLLVMGDTIATIGSKKTLDDAVILATDNMASFMNKRLGLPLDEAVSLLSLAGNLRICQVVDPNKTIRMEVPLHYFSADPLFMK